MYTNKVSDMYKRLREIDAAMANKSLTDEERDMLNEKFLDLELEIELFTGQW